ncbi:MAG: hypothetical protein ACPL7C_09025 [Anaerolineae bacterium]
MIRPVRLLFSMAVGLLVVAVGVAAGAVTAEDARPPAASPADNNFFVYLPLVFKAPNACEPIPGVSYTSLGVVVGYEPGKPPPENNPDYRLTLLGYNPVDKSKGLVYSGPSNDPNVPPQFTTIFDGQPTPPILNTYQANGWDWENHRPIPTPWTNPEVSVIGLQTSPKTIVRVPDSGYDIQYGYDAMVIYASSQEIALKYTRDDRISYPDGNAGYTVYIVGICVEPSLLSLYNQLNAAGRRNLPVVRGGQPIGRAWGGEIAVAIRDNGTFLDPRECDGFWKGYCW